VRANVATFERFLPIFADFHLIWCGIYAAGGYPSPVIFSYLYSAIPIWRT